MAECRRMRVYPFLVLALGAALAGINAAAAQQPSPSIGAETPDIGRVEAHVERSSQSIAVVSRLVRPLGGETECYGICYAPSTTRTAVWRCGPADSCHLYCASNPPVGGCR